jgi:ammonium transporter, Amt family
VLSIIGACLLWVGWFGFNAGSALGAGGLAVLAFANTQVATAAAAITWPLAEWIIRGKPTVLGAISGAVAGLVAITPACGFVTPASALIIGSVAGALCFTTVSYLKTALGYDDALDAFGIHGIGGIWGALATGIFLNLDVNAAVPALTMFPGGSYYYAEIIAGEASPIMNQMTAVVITVLFSGIASLVILLAIKYTIGLRVTDDQEQEGLDITQHGEEAYNQ